MNDVPVNTCYEAIKFIQRQFDRFNAPRPQVKSLDRIVDYVTNYVIKNNYYPSDHVEALRRFNQPGLTEPEKFALTAKLEYEIRLEIDRNISWNQIHLACWAALMYCWSDQSTDHLDWYKKLAEENIREYDKVMATVNS